MLLAGATGGLGRAIGAEMKRRGAALTLVSRSVEEPIGLQLSGARVALDLRSPEACTAAVAAAVEHCGRLDVVVNAVGVVAFGPVDELSVDTMEELFLTNTFVPIMLARAALPVLQPGGAIVNISGVIARDERPGDGRGCRRVAHARGANGSPAADGLRYRRRERRVCPASAAGKRLRQPFDILDGDRQRGVPSAPEWRRYLLAEVDTHAGVGVRSEREAVVFQ